MYNCPETGYYYFAATNFSLAKDSPKTLYIQKIKIRHCFFQADKSKVVNCVSASSIAQHIEASIKRNQYQSDNGSGLYCQL
jgi:hypothetical protein